MGEAKRRGTLEERKALAKPRKKRLNKTQTKALMLETAIKWISDKLQGTQVLDHLNPTKVIDYDIDGKPITKTVSPGDILLEHQLSQPTTGENNGSS